MDTNEIKIDGLLTEAPILRQTGAGEQVLNIRFAHNPLPREGVSRKSLFASAALFGTQAEQVYEQLIALPNHGVGQLVLVQARIATHSYQSPKYQNTTYSSSLIASAITPMAKSANTNSALVEGQLHWVGTPREWQGSQVVSYTLAQPFTHPTTGEQMTAYVNASSWASSASVIVALQIGARVQVEGRLAREQFPDGKGCYHNQLVVASAIVSVPLAAPVAAPKPAVSKVRRISSSKGKVAPVAAAVAA